MNLIDNLWQLKNNLDNKNYKIGKSLCFLTSSPKLKKHANSLDFWGYIIRENYILTHKRVVSNYKYKKAKYLEAYESQRGKMKLEEIKQFLSVQASFTSHIKHGNSFNLMKEYRSFK